MRAAPRETAAALGALGAYLTTVLPRVRRELPRLEPLPREKGRNAEAVAVFATLAPRSSRAAAVRAIVALQVAIDRLDVLEEAGAVAGEADLERLGESWRSEVARLPAAGVTLPLIERAVERCLEGQRHTHAAAAGDLEGLRSWASALDPGSDYRWWERAAGACSSVAAHALIAAAADPTTSAAEAVLIDGAYHPSIGALTVLLDDLVDRDRDRAAGETNYLDNYASAEEAAERLGLIAERAAVQVDQLPDAGRHRAILTGVGAFYLSAPEARVEYAQPIRGRLLEALGPGTRALAAFTRIRRPGQGKRPG